MALQLEPILNYYGNGAAAGAVAFTGCGGVYAHAGPARLGAGFRTGFSALPGRVRGVPC